MAVKISYFWERLTDMISSVINMLRHETVSTQNPPTLPSFGSNDSLHTPKAKNHVKLFRLLEFQILKMFHSYKEH